MRILNVHDRELDAPPAAVDDLLSGLGGPTDRLWPVERWPDTPLILDGPPEPGSSGGHGLIRYRVTRREPGRLLAFRFTGPRGLEGVHRFEIEPAGEDRSVLRHVLDADVGLRMRPVVPALERAHDLLLEDLLDNAARELGGTVRELPRPRWLDAADRLEGVLTGARGPGGPPAAGLAAAGGLLAIAGVHAYWALGGTWPGSDRRELAELVVGPSTKVLPPAPLTWGVAGALAAGAGAVGAATFGVQARIVRTAALGTAGVLALRGAGGLAWALSTGLREPYYKLDAALYSPLCVALAAGAWASTGGAARSAKPAIA